MPSPDNIKDGVTLLVSWYFWGEKSKGLGTNELQGPGPEEHQMQTDDGKVFSWAVLLILFSK